MTAKRRRKKNSSLTWRSLGLLAVAVAIAVAWKYIEAKAIEPQESESAQSAQNTHSQAGELMKVTSPSGTPEEIIHYPGFTVSFNPKHHQPNWVAWELTGYESTTNVVGARKNNFAPDPNVDGCPTLDDYKGSGFDRGHMAPAGDMKWSEDASNACFLLTNMSPQKNSLNSGSWRHLEEKCRSWAQTDSAIVIICGPVLTDRLKRSIGSTKVTVPERYFKVVLSPFSIPPKAIGFIMPNTENPGGMQAAAMSVDEVEAITGLDFFSALPDDIENAVEAKADFNAWQKKKNKKK